MDDPTPVPAINMPQTVTLESRRCPGCGTVLEVEVTMLQAQEFLRPGGRLIQEIFPDMSVEVRERLKTGYCGPCWDRDMKPPDEDLHADSGDYGVNDG